jgi:hypothetical protein
MTMGKPAPSGRLPVGQPALSGGLPRPLATVAPIGVGGIYLIPAVLLGLVVALNRDTWVEMLSGEGNAFSWISCGLLLSSGVVSTLTGLLQRATPQSERPSPLTSAGWLACGAALFVASLDEGFRVHERVTLMLGLNRAGPVLAYTHPLLILYGLGGLAFLILVVWRRYRHCTALKVLVLAGLVAYGGSMGFEALTSFDVSPVAEEGLEFAAEASFLAAFFLAFVAELASIARVHLTQAPSAPA